MTRKKKTNEEAVQDVPADPVKDTTPTVVVVWGGPRHGQEVTLPAHEAVGRMRRMRAVTPKRFAELAKKGGEE